jgi:peptide deformylase
MIELMHQNRGVGLAANQVAVPLRIFIANPTGEQGKERVFINPQIIETTGWIESEEGCLSVPQIQTNIRRQQKVAVKAIDLKGNPFEMRAEGLLARIIQHETDHINGKIILDRMSRIAKISHRRQIQYLEQQVS